MKEQDINNERFNDLNSPDTEMDQNELNDVKNVFDSLMNDPDPEVSKELDGKFYSLLENEKKEGGMERTAFRRKLPSARSMLQAGRIAAGIALFIMGWLAASWLSTVNNNQPQLAELSREVSDLKESLVLTMLSQNSPSERIQAVNMVGEMDDIDNSITVSMISVLNNDPNDNVRLVALEMLVGYIHHPEVREGMIRSISLQKSPLIQLRLAEIMQLLEEERSVPEFQKILSDITLDYSVREKINETMKVLL